MLRYEAGYAHAQAEIQSDIHEGIPPLPMAETPTCVFTNREAHTLGSALLVDMQGAVDLMVSQGAEREKLQSMGLIMVPREYDDMGYTDGESTIFDGVYYAPAIDLPLSNADGPFSPERLNFALLHEIRHLLQPDHPAWYMRVGVTQRPTPGRLALHSILYKTSWYEYDANAFARRHAGQVQLITAAK